MKSTTTRARARIASLVMILTAFGIFSGTEHADARGEAKASAGAPHPSAAKPADVKTEVGEVKKVSPGALPGLNTAAPRYAEQCHTQDNIYSYLDASGKPFIKFTGVKIWCYNGEKVTRGGMRVETWIREDQRYGPGQNGYRYVASGLEATDRFLTFRGHPNGAHESVRIGRFEYRGHGWRRPVQVLNPFISRTGRYNGSCVGPKHRDVSPKVGAVRPVGGARGVSPSANVEATFNRSMDATSINESTFQLVERNSFDPVGASFRYDAKKRMATLDPSRGLAPGTYTATVFGGPLGALTSEGDPLVGDKTWSFTVSR